MDQAPGLKHLGDFDGGFGYRQVTMTLMQMWVIL
jgi:hypothetical protein